MTESVLDLTSCDTEPIQFPEAIQPHGVLVAFREIDFVVVRVSANVATFPGLGLEGAAVLDQPLGDLVGAEASALVAAALRTDDLVLENPLRLTIRNHAFDGSLHRSPGVVILELEPIPIDIRSIDRLLRDAVTRLQRAQTLEALHAVAAEQIRILTGFDRVMVYRFHADGHGEVVAEDVAPGNVPLLGLHYPASDIPRQARQLYLLNAVRVIPDAAYQAVRLLGRAGTDAPAALDLSFAALRAVSPTHVEYLANMGVAASMSVSLIRGDQLWGLLACHHGKPQLVPSVIRSACEVIGKLASLQIDAFEERALRAQRDALRGGGSVLLQAMRSGPDGWATALLARSEDLLRVVHADGAAVVDGSGIRTTGEVPTMSEIASLAVWLDREKSSAFATSAIGNHQAARVSSVDVAGVLAVRIPRPRDAYLIWFRRELRQTVSWSGEPVKAVSTSPGDDRIHPRRSFATWKEIVRGTARPWTSAEIDIAQDLARGAIEVDLHLEINRAERAVRSRDDLLAVVSHDLKSPLNVVQMASQLVRTQIDADAAAPLATLDRVDRATHRMTLLITDLLDLAKIEAGRFEIHLGQCEARALVLDAVALQMPAADQKSVSIDSQRVEPLQLVADRDRMFQVLTNLLSNAIKFSSAGGIVSVAARRVGVFTHFAVSDQGPGLTVDLQSHVFERYWQAPKSRAREGSGLGLFIAKGLVEAHGGRIWVDSTSGAGSTFTFSVPSLEIPKDRPSTSTLS